MVAPRRDFRDVDPQSQKDVAPLDEGPRALNNGACNGGRHVFWVASRDVLVNLTEAQRYLRAAHSPSRSSLSAVPPLRGHPRIAEGHEAPSGRGRH